MTASDGTDTPVVQSFVVTIQPDATTNPANPFASVTPAAPGSVTFLPPSGASSQYTNLNNSTSGHALQFQVSGVTSGNIVEILADGNPIGQATASGATVTVTTDGSTALTDGPHQFTAIQIAPNQTVSVNESNASGGTTPMSQTADVPSLNSPSVQVTVDATPPQFNFTPCPTAVVSVPYSCQVAASSDSGGAVSYQLLTSPTGMTINATTGLISWTPSGGQVGAEQRRGPGHRSRRQHDPTDVQRQRIGDQRAPVLVAGNPATSLGTTDENTAITVSLATFINNGSGTTTITDSDTGAVVGGIALTATMGSGTWEYSLDGTTFTAVGTVSESSALLLPANAVLSYTPNGTGGETASITYRAWDTTGGADGIRVDLSQAGAVGGSTPYSTATDTASLTVTSVNRCAGPHRRESLSGQRNRQYRDDDPAGGVYQQWLRDDDHYRRGHGRRGGWNRPDRHDGQRNLGLFPRRHGFYSGGHGFRRVRVVAAQQRRTAIYAQRHDQRNADDYLPRVGHDHRAKRNQGRYHD